MTKLDCKIGKSENEPNDNDNTATTESAGGNINNEV